MIRFALICDADHRFESWFASGAAFDALKAAGHLACPVCGTRTVGKALMTPRIASAADDCSETAGDAPATAPQEPVLSAPADSTAARAMMRLKTFVEANSEDVGLNFAREARAIHEGAAPRRAIRGQASGAEAKALADEGIEAVALPFADTKRFN